MKIFTKVKGLGGICPEYLFHEDLDSRNSRNGRKLMKHRPPLADTVQFFIGRVNEKNKPSAGTNEKCRQYVYGRIRS